MQTKNPCLTLPWEGLSWDSCLVLESLCLRSCGLHMETCMTSAQLCSLFFSHFLKTKLGKIHPISPKYSLSSKTLFRKRRYLWILSGTNCNINITLKIHIKDKKGPHFREVKTESPSLYYLCVYLVLCICHLFLMIYLSVLL